MNIDVLWSRVNWLQALLQLHLPSNKQRTSIEFYSQGEWVSKNEAGNSNPVPRFKSIAELIPLSFQLQARMTLANPG
jgi:hypothetical protein